MINKINLLMLCTTDSNSMRIIEEQHLFCDLLKLVFLLTSPDQIFSPGSITDQKKWAY